MSKEKQIEEMAKEMCEVCFSKPFCKAISAHCPIAIRDAERLYNAGYRKQKEGEWRGELRKRCDWRGKMRQYFQPNSCSVCHEGVVERTPFCPNCGAKMKGE